MVRLSLAPPHSYRLIYHVMSKNGLWLPNCERVYPAPPMQSWKHLLATRPLYDGKPPWPVSKKYYCCTYITTRMAADSSLLRCFPRSCHFGGPLLARKPAGDHHSPIPPAHTSRDASSSIDKRDSVVFNPGPSPIKASGRRLPSLRVVIPGLAIGPLAVHPDCRHYGFYDILNYFLMFAYLRTRRLATTIPRPESAIP